MKEVIVVCEGQTEEVFVNEVLAPSLWDGNVFLYPRLIATSRYSKGGSLKGQRVLRFLGNTLRQRQDTYVTTFFDLYGLPSDFPDGAETVRDMGPCGSGHRRRNGVSFGSHQCRRMSLRPIPASHSTP